MDADPKYIPADSSPFILNQEISINPNGGANGGATLGKQTPSPANKKACEVEQAAGENYTILKYSSLRTQETFNGVYNSNGVNYIERLKTNGDCDIVYVGDCLTFNPEPKNSVEQFRCGMRVEQGCKSWSGKEIIWCDGDMVSPGCLDYEASVATNFFTTPFFDICPDPCAYIQLCVPEICGCIHAEFIPLLQSEASLSNYIVQKGFKFMVKHVYYDGRASEWSDFSSLYYQETDCLGGLIGAARCLKLRIPIGNPMVEKLVVAFNDGTLDDGNNAIWYECETVEKYKSYNNSQQQWFQRELSEQVSSTFSPIDCSFDYIFCNDKNRKTIASTEFTRVNNPLPRKAQCLIQFADKFAFFNYENGFCPLAKTEIEKMQVGIDCNENGCISEMVEVLIRGIIYRPIPSPGPLGSEAFSSGLVYRLGGDSGQEPDNPLDTALYTAFPQRANNVNSGQQFYDQTRNFIAYVEGTEYWTEMKQWKANTHFTNRVLVGVEPQLGVQAKIDAVYGFLKGGNYYFQEGKIKVPKGTKGFIRLVSNEVSDGFGDRQDTSVGIYGILNDITQFRTHSGPTLASYPAPNAQVGVQEMYFDTCNGNVETNQAFLIRDDSPNNPGACRYTGYIRDNLGFPIEGLTFIQRGAGNPFTQTLGNCQTDHNGFYEFVSSENIVVDIYGETDCNIWGIIKTVTFFGFTDNTTRTDILIDDSALPYSTTRYAEIDLTVKDCQGNVLPNVKAIINGSKSRTTDPFGLAKFRVRNYQDKPRTVKVIIANNGSCITQDCQNNCDPCSVDLNYTTPSCYTPVPVIDIGTIQINDTVLENKNGLKPGGFYKWAIRGKGNCGIVTSAYEFQEMNIPRLQETLRYKFCKFTYDGTGMQFPDSLECVEILRTENLNPYELQWIADKVERTIGGDLKITFQSLNDYNARFFEKTNTVYQFLLGDRVEFISNNGQILDASVYGILNYLILSPFHDTLLSGKTDAPADYFNQILIKDDGRLGIIKEGAIFEFQRPKQAALELNPYFDICCVLPLKIVPNGDGTFHKELLNPIGEFKTFDTYFIRRNIAGYVENFQHHSPSDFWGTRLTDAGRPFFTNQYEDEKRYGRNITVNSPTQLNYFGDFVKTFDGILGGDITFAFIQDDRDLLVGGECDTFLSRISNGLLELDKNGNIQAAPVDEIINNPNDEPFGIYGCQYDDIGSVISGDGFVCWWDSNMMAYVKHDYQIARDVSINKVQSFIEKRTVQKNFINAAAISALDKIRFATGQNTRTKDVYITIKRFRDSGINNEKASYLKINETIRFNPLIDEFLPFASFTPEGYSFINLQDSDGCAFITYLNGNAYIHPIINTVFNLFYGVACDEIVVFCINKFPDKEKVFMALEIQSIQKWFAVKVETDKPNFLSEITPKKVKQFERKWNASFMGNINSRAGLFGTELPSGYYCKVLLIKNNTIADIYNSINPVEQTKFNELDQIIAKFPVKEQSGFTSNL